MNHGMYTDDPELTSQEDWLRAAISATIAENLMTWLEPMFHADLARSCPQLLALAETAYDPRTSDTERATLLKRLASASRTLHGYLQRSQIGRSQAPSPDLELVAKAAEYLTSTAAALGHVFSYLPAGEAWVPTVCALAQRIPTARPGRDHWRELKRQWKLPHEGAGSASYQQLAPDGPLGELVDRVRSVQWDLLLDSRLSEEALVGAIPAFWRIHTAARSLSEASGKRNSIQSSVPDAWTSWCDTVAEGSERTIAAILIDGVRRHLDRFAYESDLSSE